MDQIDRYTSKTNCFERGVDRVRLKMYVKRLGIVSKFCFQYVSYLRKLINFYAL